MRGHESRAYFVPNPSSLSMDHQSITTDEVDREKLKQAILECTRTEVVRVLNDILGGGGGLNSNHPNTTTRAHRSISAPHLRPKTATEWQSNTRQQLNREERRPTTSHAKSNTRPSHTLPLESVDNDAQTGNVTRQQSIDRSSSNLLRQSSAIITKATGEPPKKYNDAFVNRDALFNSRALPLATNTNTNGCNSPHNSAIHCSSHNDDSDEESTTDSLQRVRSWPTTNHSSVRPTTATRMLHTSHSVLKNKPSIRRPMTTTALERRKPPPSTIASQRSKAQEFSKRLLGPITLEPKRPNCDFVVPNSLSQNEWENELARNVINVFTNKAREEIKREREEEEQQQDADTDTLIEALATISLPPQMIANRDSIFSDSSSSTFQAHEFMNDDGRDFQSIPISRDHPSRNDIDSNNTNTEFLAEEGPKQEPSCLCETKKDDGLQNGTFRLKMIWFTGTGDVGADWTVLNGEDCMLCC